MLPLVLAAGLSVLTAAPRSLPCPAPPQTPTAFIAPLRPRKLADLPDANHVLLVLRNVGGCVYQQVVRFKVSTPGSQPLPQGVLVPDGAQVQPAAPAR
jgi:hypothetical protein